MTLSPTALGAPRLRVVDTPLGPMRLQAEGGALTGAWFLDQDDCPADPAASAVAATGAAKAKAKARAAAMAARTSRVSVAGVPATAPTIPTATAPTTAPTAPTTAPTARTALPSSAPTTAPASAIPGDDTSVSTAIPDAILDQAALELAEYFAGRRRDFSLAMAPQGTPFQRRVWDALRDLPFGTLESYGLLSRRCAQAAAVRAVAQAVGRNPISIFIPCHRIIGGNSALTGFGGGLARKQALLALEGHVYAAASADARLQHKDARQGDLW